MLLHFYCAKVTPLLKNNSHAGDNFNIVSWFFSLLKKGYHDAITFTVVS